MNERNINQQLKANIEKNKDLLVKTHALKIHILNTFKGGQEGKGYLEKYISISKIYENNLLLVSNLELEKIYGKQLVNDFYTISSIDWKFTVVDIVFYINELLKKDNQVLFQFDIKTDEEIKSDISEIITPYNEINEEFYEISFIFKNTLEQKFYSGDDFVNFSDNDYSDEYSKEKILFPDVKNQIEEILGKGNFKYGGYVILENIFSIFYLVKKNIYLEKVEKIISWIRYEEIEEISAIYVDEINEKYVNRELAKEYIELITPN